MILKILQSLKKTTLAFGSGLTVFTGQTGAGKSILLDALSLCLGSRADTDFIRHDKEKAIISAVFDIDQRTALYEILSEYGIPSETNELVVRRILVRDGNSRCFLNDYPVSLNVVKLVATHLMEIHKQFDPMLSASYHRIALDEYAQHPELVAQTNLSYQAWKSASNALEDHLSFHAAALREKEFLEHKVKELKAFSPQPQEEQTLTVQRMAAKQKDSIITAYTLVADTFDGDLKRSALNAHKAIGKFDDPVSLSLCEQIDKILSNMAEVTALAQSHLHSLRGSSASLQTIEDRLFELRHLARKYNCLPDELLDSLTDAKSLLDSLDTSSQNLNLLTEQVRITKERFICHANELSTQRKIKAVELDQHIAEELAPLKLGQSKFLTSISQTEEHQWCAAGIDSVEFLVDMNQQNVMLPLNKVASGGEMARLMLALKVCLARSGLTPGLVFDEVDSGVGGDVANAVGQRLRRLANHLQVLVITHSPQVASAGDTHWIIEKSIDDEGVETKATLLNTPQRIDEIARMLAGDRITPEAKAAAAVLLEQRL